MLPPGTVCTETYLVIGNYETEEEARNLLEYMKTRFFRFLMSLFMWEGESVSRFRDIMVPVFVPA